MWIRKKGRTEPAERTPGAGKRKRKLAGEIVEYLLLSLAIAAFLFCFLYAMSDSLAQTYLLDRNIVIGEARQAVLQMWLRSLCAIASAAAFVVLFLFMLGQRISYLVSIIEGVAAMEENGMYFQVPAEGDDELTELAESIRLLAASRREVARREQMLKEDREQWIRAMSHDIRTPLTSILSYSQLLVQKEVLEQEEMRRYAALVEAKAVQIRELADRLLEQKEAGKQRVEHVRFLMEQLAQEWEEILEDRIPCRTELSECGDFLGMLNVQDIRRIFDNLASNVEKYADPKTEAVLAVKNDGTWLSLIQTNGVRREEVWKAESHGIGLDSVRRIAEKMGGYMETQRTGDAFEIRVSLPISELL